MTNIIHLNEHRKKGLLAWRKHQTAEYPLKILPIYIRMKKEKKLSYKLKLLVLVQRILMPLTKQQGLKRLLMAMSGTIVMTTM